MRKNTTFIFTAAILAGLLTIAFAAKSREISKRNGNTEIVESQKDGKTEYRIIYTYDGKNKVKGEYWETVDPKEKGKKKPQSNILSGTPMAKKYESVISSSKVTDKSGIEIDIEKDGFILKSVKTVKYNEKALPVHVAFRGYTSYPVLGVFNLKTDWEYSYDAKNMLSGVVEKNMSLDSLLLNMAAENSTKIERDQSGRPVKITRTIGTVPPVFETTVYSYDGNTPNMKTTVYRKCGLDTKSLSAVPTETISSTYGKNIPWEGMKKYEFEMGKTVTAFSVYDEVNKSQKLDGSGFMKMNIIKKGMFLKNMYSYYKNEQKGPKWRMGELPDLPDPYLIYKDNVWYK